MKLFELGITASAVSVQLLISQTTTEIFYDMIRHAITEQSKLEKIIADVVIQDKTQDFVISIIDGIVNISPNTNRVKSSLFNMKRTRVPSKETAYTFNYTNVKPKNIEKCINQMPIEQSYFWRFAKEKLQSYRGTKLNYLYMYLKEIEFRYNNKNENLFGIIVAKIAQFGSW